MGWFDNILKSKTRVFDLFNGKNFFEPNEYGFVFSMWAHNDAIQRVNQIKEFESKDSSQSYIRLMSEKPLPLFACLLALNLSVYYVDAIMLKVPSDVLDQIAKGINDSLSKMDFDPNVREVIDCGFRIYTHDLLEDMKNKNSNDAVFDTGMQIEKGFMETLWGVYSELWKIHDFEENNISLMLEKENIGRVVIMLSVMHTFGNLRGEMNVKFIP